MLLKDLYDFDHEDLKQAKLCADEIVNIINKYDLKPVPLEAIISTLLNNIREDINKQIGN
jgi:hypothetical protein